MARSFNRKFVRLEEYFHTGANSSLGRTNSTFQKCELAIDNFH
jgi:hypothetical protein